MPTRSADDFDAIRKHLEIIREREGEQPLENPKTTPENTVSEDREPAPSADYGLCYQGNKPVDFGDGLLNWANNDLASYRFAGPFLRVGDVQTSNYFKYQFILLDNGLYPYPNYAGAIHPYVPIPYPQSQQHYAPYNITVKD